MKGKRKDKNRRMKNEGWKGDRMRKKTKIGNIKKQEAKDRQVSTLDHARIIHSFVITQELLVPSGLSTTLCTKPGDQEKSDDRKSVIERKVSGRVKFFKHCSVTKRLAYIMSIFAFFLGTVNFPN